MISISDYIRNAPVQDIKLRYKLLGHLLPEFYWAESIHDFQENGENLKRTPSLRSHLSPWCWNYALGEILFLFTNTNLSFDCNVSLVSDLPFSIMLKDVTGTLPVLPSSLLEVDENLTPGRYHQLFVGYQPNKSCWLLKAEKFGPEAAETSLETVIGDFSFSF